MTIFLRRAAFVLAGMLASVKASESAPRLPPAKLKPETVAAWEKAGAKFGYLRNDKDGAYWFYKDDFHSNCTDLPAFKMEWHDFVHCSGLPELEAPFALFLTPREFDYPGQRPPPKEPPAGFLHVDVSNLLRMKYLSLKEGEGIDLIPIIHGLQRLQQLETLKLGVGLKFLKKLKNSPGLPSLTNMTIHTLLQEDFLKIIGELKQLTEIRLASGQASKPKAPPPRKYTIGLRHLARLPSLRFVDLVGCEELIDADLEEVARIPELRELNISRCWRITEKGLNALAMAKKLEVLFLVDGPDIGDAWTETGKMSALRRLHVGGPSVTEAGLKRIAAIPRLQSLWAHDCKLVTDAGFAYLGAHRELTSLDLGLQFDLGERALKTIGSLTELRSLRIQYCKNVPETAPFHLQQLTHLRQLELKGCDAIRDERIEHIAKLQNLEELELWDSLGITQKCIPSICRLKKLRLLNFYANSNVRLSDQDVFSIAGLHRLKDLSLPQCEGITALGYREITKIPELETLSLRHVDGLTDGDLEVIAKSPRLKRLYLSVAQKATDSGLNELSRLKLTTLSIFGCERITKKGIEEFKAANPKCELSFLPNWRPDKPRQPKK